MGFQHETELLEDSLVLSGFPPLPKFGSSEEEFMDSDEFANSRLGTRPSAIQNPPLVDSNLVFIHTGNMKQELKRRHVSQGWLHKMVFQQFFWLTGLILSSLQLFSHLSLSLSHH